ncbi:amidophosphoribosyltransferase [Desulforhabdus amnigena]|jgi:amidophosphoribosyltransferase|uniref:Amidophosphoribosyltransferase n=1 Tax=Desulforhabdus amnigena TaxID=40218 RepID=A0A9W6D5F4_9BACT|nr:amidophosphoribosyltransferase [Desulforhabdus amnigena]NLJ28971.1 amidophosphoribosyltransferase [Deltaproteobacteria bacterium]GLI33626.1 amidophosphoribosyltransferase [Desulforhabdus amnigena]
MTDYPTLITHNSSPISRLYTPSKREECGIFGVFGNNDAAKLSYFGLYALQHRGQESAGIAVSDGCQVREYKHMGLVHDVFKEDTLKSLKGHLAIGHVRYSTTGASLLANAQPFVVFHGNEYYGIAHNGNIVNAIQLRRELERDGAIFQSTMDTEIIMHLMARNLKYGIEEALVEALKSVKGAYSLVMCTRDKLIAIRDPRGFRPLCLGEVNGSYVLASETCAFDLIEATYIRDIEPGEILIIDRNGLRSLKPFPQVPPAYCIFEFVYFARPDSNIFGQNVYLCRKRLGHLLAQENCPISADYIMPFPDSGNYAAIGFAEASKIPLEMGIIRNHYVGRTFIQPSQAMRDFGVRIKLNPVKELLHGKRVVLVEDSIIRGTTTRTRINALRQAGAREVHMVVSCPPHRFPCPYGIDFSTKGELIAASHTVDEIRQFIGLDSLNYLSLDGLLEGARATSSNHSFCLACFTGDYSIPVEEPVRKDCFEQQRS